MLTSQDIRETSNAEILKQYFSVNTEYVQFTKKTAQAIKSYILENKFKRETKLQDLCIETNDIKIVNGIFHKFPLSLERALTEAIYNTLDKDCNIEALAFHENIERYSFLMNLFEIEDSDDVRHKIIGLYFKPSIISYELSGLDSKFLSTYICFVRSAFEFLEAQKSDYNVSAISVFKPLLKENNILKKLSTYSRLHSTHFKFLIASVKKDTQSFVALMEAITLYNYFDTSNEYLVAIEYALSNNKDCLFTRIHNNKDVAKVVKEHGKHKNMISIAKHSIEVSQEGSRNIIYAYQQNDTFPNEVIEKLILYRPDLSPQLLSTLILKQSDNGFLLATNILKISSTESLGITQLDKLLDKSYFEYLVNKSEINIAVLILAAISNYPAYRVPGIPLQWLSLLSSLSEECSKKLICFDNFSLATTILTGERNNADALHLVPYLYKYLPESQDVILSIVSYAASKNLYLEQFSEAYFKALLDKKCYTNIFEYLSRFRVNDAPSILSCIDEIDKTKHHELVDAFHYNKYAILYLFARTECLDLFEYTDSKYDISRIYKYLYKDSQFVDEESRTNLHIQLYKKPKKIDECLLYENWATSCFALLPTNAKISDYYTLQIKKIANFYFIGVSKDHFLLHKRLPWDAIKEVAYRLDSSINHDFIDAIHSNLELIKLQISWIEAIDSFERRLKSEIIVNTICHSSYPKQ